VSRNRCKRWRQAIPIDALLTHSDGAPLRSHPDGAPLRSALSVEATKGRKGGAPSGKPTAKAGTAVGQELEPRLG
jgi:hypothetical protein